MKTYPVPDADFTLPSIILGLMRIKDMSDSEIRQLVETAHEVGINMVDHADIYGGDWHVCEKRFGDAMNLAASEREKLLIQSKVGIRRGWFDFSAEHILRHVDGSLAALKTDYLDVLLLHRPDALVEPEEVAQAFDTLHAAGKVRHFGVSNHTPGQIELLKSAVKQPLRFNQLQFGLGHANLVAQGIAANMGALDQSIDRDQGLLDYCRLNGVMVQAWSPFRKPGGGSFVGDREGYDELNTVLDELAEKHSVNANSIATAWITRHPANIQVVLGTTRVDRVRDAAAGSDVQLEREDWYKLFRAAGYEVP